VTLLSVRGLRFAYPADGASHECRAGAAEGLRPFSLEGIDLEMREGEMLGVLGPNGSGKSTLLKLLSRALTPAGGEIFLQGAPLGGLTSRAVARSIAVVPQEMSTVFSLSVRQMVSLGLYPRADWFGWAPGPDRGFVDEVLKRTDLWELRDRLTTRLSGGERRRVLLARALVQRPRLLLLDEPTTHLDPRHQVEFVNLLERLRRDEKVAVIAVLHDLSLAAAWCPRLLILSDGRAAAQGPTDEVLSPERLAAVYGVPAAVSVAGGRRQVDFFQHVKGERAS